MAEDLPHLLGDIGREQAEPDGDRLGGLPDGRVGSADLTVDRLAGGVHQLHQPGDHDVEPLRVQQVADVGQRLMGGTPQRGVAAGRVGADLAGHILGDPIGPLQEPHGGARRHIGPVDVVLRRAGEHHGGTDRVDTVLVDLGAQVDPVAERLAHRLALVDHLALVQQPLHRLDEVDHPHVVQHLGEEAHVEQVQDRVLDAADVLEDRHPATHIGHLEGPLGVLRRAVAEEVPGRVDEGVHGVGVPGRRATARRAFHLAPLGGLRAGQRRGALRPQVRTAQIGQPHRQLVVGHRDLAVDRAVDDRDRAAPEPLPGQQPVPQPVGDRLPAGAARGQQVDDLRDTVGLVGQPFERLGVHVAAVAGGRDERLGRVRLTGVDDPAYRQVEGLGEVQVALVVCGHRHHRAGAVVGQHVVGGVDRQLLAVDRVGGVHTEEDTGLLPLGGLPLDLVGLLGLFQICFEFRPLLGRDDLLGQIRVRGHHEEGRAIEGVRPGGEDRHRFAAPGDGEIDVGPLRAADPVALHRQHPVGPPALQTLHVIQQPVGVLGDLEVPLVQLALGDDRAAAFAAPVDDLLVGQHGLVVGAPVDRRILAVGQPALTEAQEQPLGPVVVLRVGGVQPPVPVQAQAVALERVRLGLDVGVGPLGGALAVLDRGILRGQTEGVPADRMQHVVTALAQVAGDDIAHHERLRVAHVQVTRGVGEHVEHVAALLGAVVERREGLVLLPELLPLLLGGGRIVRLPLRYLLGH